MGKQSAYSFVALLRCIVDLYGAVLMAEKGLNGQNPEEMTCHADILKYFNA